MRRPADESDRPRLLVVDDDRDICELLAEGLASIGYSARTAGSAREALEIVEQEPIRLVLSDIEMPDVDGFELLGSVKAHDADVDVIMITGATDAGTAVRAMRSGASDYLTKPFSLEEVQIVVERTLDKRRLVLENRAYQERLEGLVETRTRNVLKKASEVTRLYDELALSYESTLQALVTALDYRDNETQGHSYRVVEYAGLVAGRLGITGPESTWIRRGSILHDVGKIGVPDAVLRKPGKLNEPEWKEMRRHPELGYRMLKKISFLRPCLDIVLYHQERFDGSGYPRGLREDRIPLGARVFAVVDAFDAMTSNRPYRKAVSVPEARDAIRKKSGSQFDPDVTRAFLSIDESKWHDIRRQVRRKVRDLGERNKPFRNPDPS